MINLFVRRIGCIASETHLDISRTSSIEDSCIKVGDENHEHRDQEARRTMEIRMSAPKIVENAVIKLRNESVKVETHEV